MSALWFKKREKQCNARQRTPDSAGMFQGLHQNKTLTNWSKLETSTNIIWTVFKPIGLTSFRPWKANLCI